MASLLSLAFNYSYSIADKDAGSASLGCFSSGSAHCPPELGLSYHHLPPNGNQPPEGEPGLRKNAMVMGTHMDTNSHTCRP